MSAKSAGLFAEEEEQEEECIHVRATPRWRTDGSYGVDCMCGKSWPTLEEWQKTEGGRLVLEHRARRRRQQREEEEEERSRWYDRRRARRW